MNTELPPLPHEVQHPPHVEFELRSVEDRDATIKAGVKIMKDEEFCIIYPRGGRDTVAKRIPPSPKAGQYPNADYLDFQGRFGKQYEAWKAGLEAPVEGTDLRTFRLLSPAEIDNCRSYHIHTVEQLAEASEEALSNIGMGSRNLKMTAQRWLEFGENGGKQLTRLEDLEAKNNDLTKMVEQLNAKLQDKSKPGRKPGRPPKENPVEDIPLS